MRKLLWTMPILLFIFTCTVFAEQPVLKQKRTCEQCRQLADKGAYEESIKAYKEFIENNHDSFQIDDAYFAIADIYDTKLFDYENALLWYDLLKRNYSQSTLVSLADQRIKYLTSYADYNFKPLSLFERIRSIEYAQKKEIPQERDNILKFVNGLVKEYPDSNIAPVMQHWLANQYRLFAPGKAVDAYMTLRKNYGTHSEAKETMIEIGETYYDAGEYRESVSAFEQAIKENPEMEKTIQSQILRAKRNILREDIAHFSVVICIGIFAAAFLLKPHCISFDNIIKSFSVFILFGILLYIFGWKIKSEFNTFNQLILFVVCLAASIGLSALISLTMAQKVKNNILGALLGTSIGLLFLTAGIYITIYYVYVHFLIVFKL